MARMLGTFARPWCPVCKGPAGPDCPDQSRDKKAQRAWEKREWRRAAQSPAEAGLWTSPDPR